jgi:hypothetical protein
MTFGELIRALNTVPITAHNDPVMFLDRDNVEMFDIKRVQYEQQSDDGEGNVTSVGGTVWIYGETH